MRRWNVRVEASELLIESGRVLEDDDQRNTEVGLRPRLIAAVWFASAALLPVILFFVVFGGWSFLILGKWDAGDRDLNILMVWLFGVVPVSAAAFWGFTVGSRLTDENKTTTPLRAAIRGISLALLSYLLFMAFYFGTVALASVLPNQNQSLKEFPVWFFLIFVLGLVYVGWLIVIAGAIAGPLLADLATSSRFGKELRSSPRVSTRQARIWAGLAAFLFLSNYVIVVLLLVMNQTATNE